LVFLNSVTVDGTHPDYQNPVMNGDVVNDGLIRVSDAHAVINDLLANGSRTIEGPFTGTNYLDVNGSGTISVADAHNVINILLADAADAAQAAPLAFPSSALSIDSFDSPGAGPLFTVVPEPTSLSLAALAAISLAGGAIWRRRRLAARPKG
jgi:hypothetical protein